MFTPSPLPTAAAATVSAFPLLSNFPSSSPLHTHTYTRQTDAHTTPCALVMHWALPLHLGRQSTDARVHTFSQPFIRLFSRFLRWHAFFSPCLGPPPYKERPGSPCSIFHARARTALSSYKPSQGFITTHLMQIRQIWVDCAETIQSAGVGATPQICMHSGQLQICSYKMRSKTGGRVAVLVVRFHTVLFYNNVLSSSKNLFITDVKMWFSTLCQDSSWFYFITEGAVRGVSSMPPCYNHIILDDLRMALCNCW